MLLLWVFAIANACVLDPLSIGQQRTSGDRSIFHVGVAAMPLVVTTDVVIGMAIDSTGSIRLEGPCVDTSDFGPPSVVGILPDAGLEQPNLLPPAVTRLSAVTPIDLVQSPIDEQRPLETAIPLRVRYVRMAL